MISAGRNGRGGLTVYLVAQHAKDTLIRGAKRCSSPAYIDRLRSLWGLPHQPACNGTAGSPPRIVDEKKPRLAADTEYYAFTYCHLPDRDPRVGRLIPPVSWQTTFRTCRRGPGQACAPIAMVDGEQYAAGDSDVEFTIQSISKPFVYALALADRGYDDVLAKVGVEPSGEPFNEAVPEDDSGKPLNPMINAGAITTHSLVGPPGATQGRAHGTRHLVCLRLQAAAVGE